MVLACRRVVLDLPVGAVRGARRHPKMEMAVAKLR